MRFAPSAPKAGFAHADQNSMVMVGSRALRTIARQPLQVGKGGSLGSASVQTRFVPEQLTSETPEPEVSAHKTFLFHTLGFNLTKE